MQKLIAIEAIKNLKARYFRALDTKDWALFGDCLTADIEGRYSDGDLNFNSKKSLVAFMVDSLSATTMVTMHQGHHPEIIINDDGEQATGVWYLQDMVIDLKNRVRLYGSAIYKDDYRIEGEQWKISKTGYTRIFECMEPLSDKHVVLKNMFAGS